MAPKWTYRFAILIAGLFLLFQGLGVAHAVGSEDITEHAECVLCHVVSEQSEIAIAPDNHLATEILNQVSQPTYYNPFVKGIWTLTPPERAPPPRGPPAIHI